MASLSLKHINKTYPNGFEAVKDFNLEIEDKEFIIFVGPSGCGNGSAGMGEEYCFSGGRTFNRKREIVCQCKKQWCPCADRRKGTTGKCSRDDVCCYASVSE